MFLLARLSVDDVLSHYVYVFVVAFIVSLIFTPIMRVVAMQYGIVDKPDGMRKLHRAPVAYLGGVAVFLGWLAGLAFSHFLVLHRGPTEVNLEMPNFAPNVPVMIAVAGIVIMLLGLVDDIRGVRPWMKIGGQILAALLLASQRVGTHSLGPMLGGLDERLQVWNHHVPTIHYYYIPEWFVVIASTLLIVCLVVFCCNASNLMDGLDGLCGGVTAIISLGYVFLAVHVAQGGTQFPTVVDGSRVIIALALLGGVLGFVPYNFNPASIFMGDTGSMFLGFAVATMMLLMGEVASKWLLASFVMFALPTLDTALAFTRRYVNKRPFFSADKHHIHHQFLARGLSVKQTVLFLYVSSIFFVLLGSLVALMRTRYAVAMDLVVFSFIIVAAYKMGMIHEKVTTSDKAHALSADDQSSVSSSGGTDGIIEIPDRRREDRRKSSTSPVVAEVGSVGQGRRENVSSGTLDVGKGSDKGPSWP